MDLFFDKVEAQKYNAVLLFSESEFNKEYDETKIDGDRVEAGAEKPEGVGGMLKQMMYSQYKSTEALGTRGTAPIYKVDVDERCAANLSIHFFIM